MRKAFVTEIFTEMLQMMQTTIDACEQGYLDQIKQRVKLYLYVGTHNIILLANTLNFTFPDGYLPYASLLRFDL